MLSICCYRKENIYIVLKLMCPYCSSACTLFGKSSNGYQRYRCKSCNRTHSKAYAYKACQQDTGQWIVQLTKEGMGIRSIGRVLKISCTTVLRTIVRKAKMICKPTIILSITNYIKIKNMPEQITRISEPKAEPNAIRAGSWVG